MAPVSHKPFILSSFLEQTSMRGSPREAWSCLSSEYGSLHGRAARAPTLRRQSLFHSCLTLGRKMRSSRKQSGTHTSPGGRDRRCPACAGSRGHAKKPLWEAQPLASGERCRRSPVPTASVGRLRHGEMSCEASTVQDPIQIPYNRVGQVSGELERQRGLGLRYLLPADFSFIFNTQRNRR